MTGRPGAIAVLGLPTLLLACQPLPHPFEDDRPPAALVRIHDTVGVSIAPIVGGPRALADKLAAATASALQKRDIPASDKTMNLRSYQLYGRIAAAPPKNGSATVTVLWRLFDAKGRSIGEPSVKLAAKPQDWDFANEHPVAQLAEASADKLAPMLEEVMPAPAPESPGAAEAGRVRIAVGEIKGAPGDGATSLATAVAAVLKQQDQAVVVANGGKADLYVVGDVAVSPVKPDKQHVKIVWHVRRADGAEIGTVGEENDVPKGMLDGPWGDLAYGVAIAAGDGLMQLVARGAPEPKPQPKS